MSGPAGPHDESGIWVISIVGRTIRKLRDEGYGAVVSPDGTQIAFLAGGIWLMGVDGEESHELVSSKKGYGLGELHWSPEGQWLAYMKSHRDYRNYAEVTIESRDLRGGQTTTLLSDPELIDFCWAPDGRIIYSRLESPNEISSNLWEVRIDPQTGRASGEPRRLTSWAGFSLRNLQMTVDGKRLGFARKHDESDVYVVELEGNGIASQTLRRLTLDDRMDWPGGWTRNSGAVLFFSDRNGNFNIFKQDIRGGPAEEIAGGAEEKRSPPLSPDGSWILYLSWPKMPGGGFPSMGRLMRVPVSGGPPQLVLETKGYPGSARAPRERWVPSARGYPDFRCPVLPATSCILAEATLEQIVFSAFDALQGDKSEVTRLEVDAGDTFWDLSPDGSRIAFGKFDPHHGNIRILPLRGGTARQISVQGWSHLNSVGWSADGKSLFVTKWGSRAGSLIRVDLNGVPQSQPLELFLIERPVASPNGRHLAFAKLTPLECNAWMIEHF